MEFHMDNGQYRRNSFVSHKQIFEAIPITFSAIFRRYDNQALALGSDETLGKTQ
jgi:hypothetical protein